MNKTKLITKCVFDIMKFSLAQAFIIALFVSWANATDVSGQKILEKKISIEANQREIEQILADIEIKAEVRFTYSTEIDAKRIITLNAVNQKLSEVLDNLFDYRVEYIVNNKQIILRVKGNEMKALRGEPAGTDPSALATLQITGTVLDENNQPLPGVNVLEKGTTNGTSTDKDGRFKLNVADESAVVVVSFIGYTTQEIIAGKQTELTVTLQPDVKSLGEVVVVGYGTQKKSELSTSVVSLDAKNIAEHTITNATQAMAGQMAGVSVQSATGSPGTAPIIRIRGAGSLSAGNDPLIVVDGFPLSSTDNFDQISPNDIEGIEVLKDAAAAAIYGSRGGNGVIIVTTKRGKTGQAKFNFTASEGFEELSRKTPVLNAAEFVDYSREALALNPLAIVPSYYNDPSKWGNTDWQDVIFRQARNRNYQLSANGGTEKLQYSVSGGYLKQEGILIGTDYERFNFRLNMDLQVHPKMKMGISLAPNYSFRNDRPTNGENSTANYYSNNNNGVGVPGQSVGSLGAVYTALVQVPILPVFYENGDYAIPRNDPFLRGTSINQNFYNPLAYLELQTDNTQSLRSQGNMYFQYEIIKGLTLKVNFGAETINGRRNTFLPSTMAYNNSTNASFSTPNLRGIASSQGTNQTYNWLLENTLNYDKKIGDHHTFALLAGYAAQKNTFESNGVASRAGSFNTDAIEYVSLSSDIFGTAFKSANSLISSFFRLNYNYKQKYLLSAAIRQDGSSRFGADNRFALFPSGSVAWRVSEEPFLKNNPVVSELKIRGSYGVTGNNNIGDFSSVAVLGGDHYTLGSGTGAAEFGFSPTGFTNTGLTWETNTQTDLGLEVGLLQNRIFLAVDVYERNTDGLLARTPISSVAGFSSSYLRNVGSIRNRGLEIELVSRNLTGRLSWTTNANFSANQNEITDYYKEGPDYFDAVFGWNTVYRIQKGGSLGDLWGYVADGVFMNQAEVDAGAKWLGNSSAPGDVRYKDLNGDGKITTDDREVFANALPDFTYGITNTFAYKGFDLRILLQGVQGSNIVYGIGRNTDAGLTGTNNATSAVLGRWKSEAQPGDGVTPRVRNGGNSGDFSSRFVYNGSFLRIRNVTLGYNVPKHITDKLRLQNARVYLSTQNLHTFTDYFGYNPEVNIELGSALRYGVDQGSYPLPRSFSAGLNVGF